MNVRDRGLSSDELGAVYVEFLLAFPPLFLLFMAICQLSLAATAHLVVAHAATRAARSAIVVLEDDPERYGGAPRGRLSEGEEPPSQDFANVLGGPRLTGVLGLGSPSSSERASSSLGLVQVPQQGARMRPIRNAAYLPLVSLAPQGFASATPLVVPGGQSDRSLSSALSSGDFARHLLASLDYTRAVSVVTLNSAAGSPALVAEPVERNAAVTVRVTYLYRCSVPVVRSLVCRSLVRLLTGQARSPSEPSEETALKLAQRLELAEDRMRLRELVQGAYFKVIEAEATLPNQGAAYYTSERGGAP